MLQFNKTQNFKMYQESVMVPIGRWAQTRLKNLGKTDLQRDESHVQSGFGKNVSNWLDRGKVYPTNVLHMATECYNRKHSAVFPESLPEWFIKLFTEVGDWVLDPFMGSGTTLKNAVKMARNSIGIDIDPQYCEAARWVLKGRQLLLYECATRHENNKQKKSGKVRR